MVRVYGGGCPLAAAEYVSVANMAELADSPDDATRVALYLHEVQAIVTTSLCQGMFCAVSDVPVAGAHSTRFPSPWGTKNTVPSAEYRR